MLFLCVDIQAQSVYSPKLITDSIVDKYPDHKIAIANSTEFITFSVNKYADQLEIRHKLKDEIVVLKPYSSFVIFRYYDRFSEITKKKFRKPARV